MASDIRLLLYDGNTGLTIGDLLGVCHQDFISFSYIAI